MPERMGHTEPFQSGQNSAARGKSEKVPVKFNMSKTRNAGNPDPLSQALTGRQSYMPSDMHRFSHGKSSKPSGAHYRPAGEFGRPTAGSGFKSLATGMGSHTSRPGANAVGSPKNRHGGNPLGGHGGRGTFRGRP